ncbi:MAG: ATP-dependent DNA ligase [Acidimicrobiia bacterium]|nr:ATP-dependent DNA ligase [Acidimicrobiia bacterium]
MLLRRLVEASAAIGATRSRTEKVRVAADHLRALAPHERAIGAGYLAGSPRQDRLGVGHRTLAAVEVPPAGSPTLTLGDVDDALEAIAAEEGPGSAGRRLRRLEALFGAATTEEQSFLRSLVLREVRQGALEGILVGAIARAADVDAALVRRAAMVSGDLPAVAAAALDGGADAVSAFSLTLHRPVEPMLASTAADGAEALDRLGRPVRIEAKVDGARIQVHRTGARVTIHTRNLREVTDRLPGIVAAVEAVPVDAVVLDGEAILVDDRGVARPFQETMSRFGSAADAEGSEPMEPRFFDVLHLDGRDLLDEPLSVRMRLLADLVPEQHRMPSRTAASPGEVDGFLSEVIGAGHEGVMVKDPDSTYAAGRRGSAWLKIKPVHTLDLVILAAEWDSGRRRGRLSNLHLGARDPDGGFVMLGKTFKGLTDEMLEWQTERLLGLETARSGRVVRVAPEQVVEIAIDGVQVSSRYPGGMALRFARVKGYRSDKAAADADTVEDVRAILERRRPSG